MFGGVCGHNKFRKCRQEVGYILCSHAIQISRVRFACNEDDNNDNYEDSVDDDFDDDDDVDFYMTHISSD